MVQMEIPFNTVWLYAVKRVRCVCHCHLKGVYLFYKVHFEGQPIAAVVAETRDQAKQAVQAIKVEYKDLKHILTIRVRTYYYFF